MTNWKRTVAATTAALLLATGTAGAQSSQEKPRTANPRTADEIVPGVPLDGSIIIDESVWVSLIGEPGRHMSAAFEQFTKGNLTDSAESVRRASSFLYVASENALEGPSLPVHEAAVALDDLHRRVADGKVQSAGELKVEFGRAHLAMSRHHAAKASDAFKKKKWVLAGSYLNSSANHLSRASFWSGRELRKDTEHTLTDARQTAGHLVEEGGRSVERAGQLIEMLGKRIERFGKSMAELNRDDSSQRK